MSTRPKGRQLIQLASRTGPPQHQHFNKITQRARRFGNLFTIQSSAAPPLGSSARFGYRGNLFFGGDEPRVLSVFENRTKLVKPLGACGLVHVWPAALTTIIVAAQARRTKLAILVLYFLIFALINAIAMSFSPTLRIGHVILYWAVYNVPPSVPREKYIVKGVVGAYKGQCP